MKKSLNETLAAVQKFANISATLKSSQDVSEIEKLRDVLSKAHDDLYQCMSSSTSEEKKAIYEMVKAYAITYKAQYEKCDEEYNLCLQRFNAKGDFDQSYYDNLKSLQSKIAIARTKAKNLFDTYVSLEHYVGAFVGKLRGK